MSKLVRLVLQSDGEINLPELRRVSGLSIRQFERRFKAIAGFSPMHYARIIRFQSSKRKYVSQELHTLTELAHHCNYTDQSHFSRDFKEFSGMTTKSYFRLLDDDLNNECQIIKGLIIATEIPTILTA
ncbi:MAG: helix-turn-helix domain-containing protein [Chryseolinea sp.]